MVQIDIKPLSVNAAWQGKRFKTPAYKKYEKNVLKLLPKLTVPSGRLTLKIEFGFSSKLMDIDNPVKLLGDILQKKYGFNDRDIYRLEVDKRITPKGQEYIKFEITKFEE